MLPILGLVFLHILLGASALALPSDKQKLTVRTAERPTELLRRRLKARGHGLYDPKYWAGAIHHSDTPDTWKEVKATIVIPEFKPHSPVISSGAAWVGFDTFSCDSNFVNVGFMFDCTDPQGSFVAVDAWYSTEDVLTDFGIQMHSGDHITASIVASDRKSATITIKNENTGEFVEEGIGLRDPLCLQDAEWVVSGFSDQSDSLIDIPNFDTVIFMNASATSISGTKNLSGAKILNIHRNGTALTTVKTTKSDMMIKRVRL